jgi:alcohol dehydrogenase (cytochrome c)
MIKRALFLVVLAAGILPAQVSVDRLLRSDQEPQNWYNYSGGYSSQRYSRLTQITPDNVRNLELSWVFQLRSVEPTTTKFEATPIVVDGIMYTVQPPNDVFALDATTGKVFWSFTYRNSDQARACCGRVNRGLAILGDTLFMGTLDDHVIALDAKTGKQIWNVTVDGARPEAGYSFTVAPLVVRDKVILGPAGGEFGIRSFLAAFDVRTGKEVWRFKLIPEPGEPGNETWGGESWKTGAGSIWTTGSYDPETNLTYWGVGNPGPDWNGDNRPGDNLYTSSVVALDADTGRLKWHYQFTPHDEFDYDSTQIPVLADIQWQGRMRKVMLWANRNGFFYVLDRATGEFLSGKPFVKVTWADGTFDAKGRPHRVAVSSTEGVLVFPGNQGGTNWYSPSYSPRTGLFYLSVWDNYSSLYVKAPATYREGQSFGGGNPRGTIPQGTTAGQNVFKTEEEGFGAVRALDPRTGEKKWDFKMTDFTDSGILTTATDVLFTGGREGYFFALDARTGKMLWRASVGGRMPAGPMTYAVNGRQYVSIAAGSALFTFTLRQ